MKSGKNHLSDTLHPILKLVTVCAFLTALAQVMITGSVPVVGVVGLMAMPMELPVICRDRSMGVREKEMHR